jgi:VWFA-related protein
LIASEPSGQSGQSQGLIQLDVAVTDTAGNPVSGLDVRDFSLLDNGQAEKIVSFHANGSGTNPSSSIMVTLVLDTFEMPLEMASQEQAAVERFLRQNGGHLAQPTWLLMLTDTGLWRMGLPSVDGNALADSIVHRRGTVWIPANPSALADQTWDHSQAPAGGKEDLEPGVTLPAERGLRALGAIAAAERRLPGKKLLIWIGPGWGIGSGKNPEEIVRKEVKPALFDRIVWFSTLLRVARLSLFSFSEGETGSLHETDQSTPSPIRPPGFPWYAVKPVTSPSEASALALNRKVLAIESGGLVLDSSGDPVHHLNECMRDVSGSYSLTFDPGPAAHPDDFHTLKVNIDLPGLKARTNTFYYDQPYNIDTLDPTIRQVTVTKLSELFPSLRSSSDADAARELSGIELTERASATQVITWDGQLPGKKSRGALTLLADQSAFLAPAAGDLTPDPPPDVNTQQRIISLAVHYLNDTIPELPNLFAERTALHFQEMPSFYKGNGTFSAAEGLHLVDTSRTTLVYRNGAELLDTAAKQQKKKDRYLVTYGTFGPVLGAVKAALMNSDALSWVRWEKDPFSGRRAVFQYAVSAAASRYEVGGCCLPDGNSDIPFKLLAPYHGEIAIDPTTGAVLQLQVQADLRGFVPLDQADVTVSYAPVTISGKTYICPVRSVGVLRVRSIITLSEWDEAFSAWGPWATQLNDFRYDDYHAFQANARMLSGYKPVSGEGLPSTSDSPADPLEQSPR